MRNNFKKIIFIFAVCSFFFLPGNKANAVLTSDIPSQNTSPYLDAVQQSNTSTTNTAPVTQTSSTQTQAPTTQTTQSSLKNTVAKDTSTGTTFNQTEAGITTIDNGKQTVLLVSGEDNVKVLNENGGVQTVKLDANGNGSYKVPGQDLPNQIHRDTNGDITITDPYSDGEITTYKSDGSISKTDAQGEVTTYGPEYIQNQPPLDYRDSVGCGWLEGTCWIQKGVGWTLALLANLILSVFSWILWICGTFLNLSIMMTVTKMRTMVSHMTAIGVSWTTFRDIANISFIFILLYISLMTILSGGGFNTKDLLVKVVIVGLLVNFSLFFTNMVIDASNIVTIGLYNKITEIYKPAERSGALNAINTLDGGLSGAMMQGLQITSLYAPNENPTTSTPTIASTAVDFFQGLAKLLTTTLGGVIIMLIASVIFFTAAILFVIRFVVLIFIMILSPLAAAAYILPKTHKYWELWKDALINQALFAPAYILLMWVAIQVSSQIQEALINTNPQLGGTATSFSSALGTGGVALVGLIINYAIVAALFVGTIILAKKIGAVGVDGATALSGSAAFAMGGKALRTMKAPLLTGKRVATAGLTLGRSEAKREDGVLKNIKNLGSKEGWKKIGGNVANTVKGYGTGATQELGIETKSMEKKGIFGGIKALGSTVVKDTYENAAENVKKSSEKYAEKVKESRLDLRAIPIPFAGKNTLGSLIKDNSALAGASVDFGKTQTLKEAARERAKEEKEEKEALTQEELENNKKELEQAIKENRELKEIERILKNMSDKDVASLGVEKLSNDSYSKVTEALGTSGRLGDVTKEFAKSAKDKIEEIAMRNFDAAVRTGDSGKIKSTIEKLKPDALASYIKRAGGLKEVNDRPELLDTLVGQLNKADLNDLVGKISKDLRGKIADSIMRSPSTDEKSMYKFINEGLGKDYWVPSTSSAPRSRIITP